MEWAQSSPRAVLADSIVPWSFGTSGARRAGDVCVKLPFPAQCLGNADGIGASGVANVFTSHVTRTILRSVIKSFADKATAALFSGRRVRRLPPDIHRRAYAKLQALEAADTLDFLRVPPSNRLEQLRGDREGQWSIRINDQWRICFRWEDRDAYDVEVTDYH